MDAESNNLMIDVADSNPRYLQYAYGALSGSDSAYIANSADDKVTLYFAIEDTVDEPKVNAMELWLFNVAEATLTIYDDTDALVYQIVSY